MSFAILKCHFFITPKNPSNNQTTTTISNHIAITKHSFSVVYEIFQSARDSNVLKYHVKITHFNVVRTRNMPWADYIVDRAPGVSEGQDSHAICTTCKTDTAS